MLTQHSERGWSRSYLYIPIDINPLLSTQPMKGCTTPPGSVRLLLFTNNSLDSFTSNKNQNNEELWDGAYGCSSLFEKSK